MEKKKIIKIIILVVAVIAVLFLLWNYLLYPIQAFKHNEKLLSDAVKGAIDWLIYGSKGNKNSSGVGTISYGSYYNRSGYINPTPVYTNPMLNNKPTLYAVNDIIIADRGEAEEVLLRMKESINSYGMVSVGDFYDLVGQRANFTDQKWGWFDLRTADIIRVDGGFCIRFPKVQPIEK